MNPTICLNMIVKNEERVIERCLTSLKNHINYWVIADTGSTDNTKSIIKDVLDDVPGELLDIPWKNFSYNRTAVLNAAKGKADFHFIIDADETFKAFDTFPDFGNADMVGINVRYEHSGFEFNRVAFLRDACGWEYKGVVHNYAHSPNATEHLLSGSCEIVHHADGYSHGDAKSKYLRNARLLEEELKRNPKDTRSAFYLGESYRDAGEKEKAIEAYQKRIDLGGWQEEVFWAMFQQALLMQSTDRLFDAYEYRPTRVEPMLALASMMIHNKRLNGAKLLLEGIVNKPIPNDVLFLNRSNYIWRMKDLLGLLYYKNKRFEAAKILYEEILDRVPSKERERILKNIWWCNKNIAPSNASPNS